MGRFLPWIIIGVLAWFILIKPRVGPKAPPSPSASGPRPENRGGEDMVRCAHCGVHLPRSEGILNRGEVFCSREHLLAHKG